MLFELRLNCFFFTSPQKYIFSSCVTSDANTRKDEKYKDLFGAALTSWFCYFIKDSQTLGCVMDRVFTIEPILLLL